MSYRFFLSYQILTSDSLCYSEAWLIKYSHYVTISRNNFNLKTFLILTHEGNLKDSLMKNKGSTLCNFSFFSLQKPPDTLSWLNQIIQLSNFRISSPLPNFSQTGFFLSFLYFLIFICLIKVISVSYLVLFSFLSGSLF